MSPSTNSLAAGIANFGIQFNYSSISVAMLLISNIYGSTPTWASSATTSSVFAGSIVGMLVMGFLGDALGRKEAMMITLMVAGSGAVLSAFASFGDEDITFGLISFWRTIMGVGVGGLYPLSSVFAYETVSEPKIDDVVVESESREGAIRAASALFWQIPGQIGVYLLAILLLLTNWNYRVQWRVLMASGAIPFVIALYLLRDLKNKPSEYTNIVDGSPGISSTAENASTTFHDLYEACKVPEVRSKLIGASVAWFLFDVYLYGVMIYSPVILNLIFSDNSMSSNCWENIISIVASLPAGLGSIFMMSYVSPRTLQIIGFIVALFSFFAFSALWDVLISQPMYLFALFCYIKFAMAVFIPATTFVIPNLLFPENIRASCSGIAAASGKLGAFVGAFVFPVIYEAFGMTVEMMCCCGVAFLALLVTLVFIPVSHEAASSDPAALLLESQHKEVNAGVIPLHGDTEGDSEEEWSKLLKH